MMLAAVVVAATLANPRFFLAGDGTIGLVSAHSGETVTVTYRRTAAATAAFTWKAAVPAGQ